MKKTLFLAILFYGAALYAQQSSVRELFSPKSVPGGKAVTLQEAVDIAYKEPNFHARCVYRQGEKPTVSEVVDHLTRRAKTIKNFESSE